MRSIASLCLVFAAAPALAADLPSSYPATQRVDQVDDYHGTKVADPFRWLEDDNASQTKEWIDAQNKVTFAFLESIPQRKAIEARLTKLWNFERFGVPFKEGGRYFYSRNDGLQPQSVIFSADTLDAAPRVVIDPNTLSKDGTVALAGSSVAKDGRLWAYGLTDAGSDWNTWKVRDLTTGQDLPETLKWVKFSGASWTKDSSGFFYNRYDAPKDGAALTGVNRFPKVYFHRANTPQDQDILIYERPDQPEWGFGAGVTDDGQYLILNVSQGTDRKNRFFFRDIKSAGIAIKPTAYDATLRKMETDQGREYTRLLDDKATTAPAREKFAEGFKSYMRMRSDMIAKNGGGSAHGFVELLNDFDASYDFIDNDGPVFFFLTDLDAPRGRLIAIDTRSPARENWKTVIPQDDKATLTGVSLVGNHFIANYLNDAYSQVKVFDLAGTFVRNVDLPGIGTASGFGGKREDPETFYSFTSYTYPSTVFRYDVATGKSTVWKAPKVDFNPADYETKQVFFTSKDGTKVPMFITHKKGLKLDGSNPTHLYAYGGFNISITPSFSVANLVWMELGGVYAVANIRGGGEYGEEWHKAAIKTNRQKAFDDFIAAGEWLVANKYTSPAKLAISGRSNGGLLIGAVMAQRPDLFGAALPGVGVMDMLRFHKFTIGWAWKSDYGSSEDPEQFKALNAYSPYHAMLRAKPGTKFPATLVITADHDDRVVPGHSHKFAAALQSAGAPDGQIDWKRPLLIRVETRAGHGAGRPIQKVIEEAADMWSFLVKTLDFTPTIPGQPAGAAAPDLNPAAPALAANTPNIVPAKLTLNVGGMSCVMCSGKVTKLVKAVPGVRDCTVNLEAKQAVIDLDPAHPADAQAILAAFAGSHYQASVVR
jgi:prolyl oligopeptidase